MTKKTTTKKNIQSEFKLAEESLEFCWGFLCDLKTLSYKDNNFVDRLLKFQETLAITIFRLQLARNNVIAEEKHRIKNKGSYNYDWFRAKMKRLSTFKKGIDSVVNMSKSFGDAFAYFFYQFEEELLAKHLNHRRIINDSADIGKRGEIEFIKNVKHIEGHFTLFHDITNTLRYGDFSFINLKTLKVEKVGELKTKKVDSQTLDLSLTYFKRDDIDKKNKPLKNPELEKTRKGRQILGMANLLFNEKKDNDTKKELVNPTYSKEVEELLLSSKINQSKYVQVSEGLAFISLKSRKTSLYNNIFHKDSAKYGVNDDFKELYVEVAKKIIKKDSENNGIIIGQLLYNPDLTDKSTPGTIPLFWHPIDYNVLKQVYFLNTIVISLFNPVHLIEEIEKLGYFVDSKYSNKKREDIKPTKGIDRFDLFISYIINFLMTESFVIESVQQIENEYGQGINGQNAQISIKPQQKFDIIPATNKMKK
ncbi:hypothetical protein [Flagellimonas myxillae]|uniref:hypothetical protein n=1 Tax=Flagellimonas myxillae TaxID=2942214 RepID=UPI00201EF483|nr:hypothetical protein [Muricauda myxillae]MCL6264928.1 hypothetical protein [Muricauda myxillae]